MSKESSPSPSFMTLSLRANVPLIHTLLMHLFSSSLYPDPLITFHCHECSYQHGRYIPIYGPYICEEAQLPCYYPPKTQKSFLSDKKVSKVKQYTQVALEVDNHCNLVLFYLAKLDH